MKTKKYFVLMFGLIALFCVWGSEILKQQCERTKLQIQKRFPLFPASFFGWTGRVGLQMAQKLRSACNKLYKSATVFHASSYSSALHFQVPDHNQNIAGINFNHLQRPFENECRSRKSFSFEFTRNFFVQLPCSFSRTRYSCIDLNITSIRSNHEVAVSHATIWNSLHTSLAF
jgi:hypothetical protein